MNEIFIISSWGLGEDRILSIRLRPMIRHFLKQGWCVTCLCPRLGGNVDIDGPLFSLIYFPFISTHRGLLSKFGRKVIFPIIGFLYGCWSILRAKNEVRVFSTIPEIEALVIGVLLKAVFPKKVRLVLEIRDPFSINRILPWGQRRRSFYWEMERQLLKWPDQVIFLTSEIRKRYLDNFGANQPWVKNQSVITNGFNRLDFAESVPQKVQQNDGIVFAYVGTFYDGRDPIDFLKTLEEYIRKYPQAPSFEVRFQGVVHGKSLEARILRTVASRPLAPHVKWLGPSTHREAVRLMKNADVILIITHKKGSEYAIPGKIFEYMGAARPVLALTSDPLVVDLVNTHRMGWVCQNQADLWYWFETYLPFPDKIRAFRPDAASFAKYEIRNIHRTLENFLLTKLV